MRGGKNNRVNVEQGGHALGGRPETVYGGPAELAAEGPFE